jgi:hypothetical protein
MEEQSVCTSLPQIVVVDNLNQRPHQQYPTEEEMSRAVAIIPLLHQQIIVALITNGALIV